MVNYNNELCNSLNNINNMFINKQNKQCGLNNKCYNILYNFNNLQNKILIETNNLKLENNSFSLINDQNKQYENLKFNKSYLFIANILIILTIIGSTFYKEDL